MSNARLTLTASLLLSLATPVIPAHADEGYLCADGSIVYVKLGTLEHMKRTNACVAAYYGLKVEEAADRQPGPATSSAPIAPADTAAPALRRLPDETPPATGVARNAREAALRRPPMPAPNTDYRNVRILNAPDGQARTFHHQR